MKSGEEDERERTLAVMAGGGLGFVAVLFLLVATAPADVSAQNRTAPLGCHAHSTASCTVCEACCVDLSSDAVCEACVAQHCVNRVNRCGPDGSDGSSDSCNVCKDCCNSIFAATQQDCDSCVDAKCTDHGEYDCRSHDNDCTKDCVKHCYNKPTSPCWRQCHTKHGLSLLILSLVPFFGRFLVDYLGKKLWDMLCTPPCAPCRKKKEGGLAQSLGAGDGSPDGSPDVFDEARLREKGAIAMSEVFTGETEIEHLGDLKQRRVCGVTIIGKGALRLVFWHWMQPVIYFIVLGNYWEIISPWQQRFGALVAVREVLYLLSTVVALCANPFYLQVDLVVTLKYDGLIMFLLYLMAPEVFVWTALAGPGGFDLPWKVYFGGHALYVFLEISAVVALLVGWAAGNLVWPLAIGYAVTSVAALCTLPLFLAFVCCDGDDDDDEDLS